MNRPHCSVWCRWRHHFLNGGVHAGCLYGGWRGGVVSGKEINMQEETNILLMHIPAHVVSVSDLAPSDWGEVRAPGERNTIIYRSVLNYFCHWIQIYAAIDPEWEWKNNIKRFGWRAAQDWGVKGNRLLLSRRFAPVSTFLTSHFNIYSIVSQH